MQSVARRWLASIFRISRVRAPMNPHPHRCYCNRCYIQPADGWVFEDVRSSAAIFEARWRLRRPGIAAAKIQRWWWCMIYEQGEDQEEDQADGQEEVHELVKPIRMTKKERLDCSNDLFDAKEHLRENSYRLLYDLLMKCSTAAD